MTCLQKVMATGLLLLGTLDGVAQGTDKDTQSVTQCDVANYDPASTVIYGWDFFARYDLTNADDMLRRIPGVQAILDNNGQGQQRGFGSSGEQILVNGNRMAGKSQNVTSNLQRMQASSIYCVQLIRGTSSDIAVQSEGVIVNLIMAEQGAGEGQGTWRGNARFNDKSSFGIDGLLTYNGRWNGVGYLLSFEKNLWSPDRFERFRWSERVRDEAYFYPDGSLQQMRVQDFHRTHNKYIITTNLDYAFSNGGQLRLNGFVQPFTIRELDATPFTAFNPDGSVSRTAIDDRFAESNDRLSWEIGLEYEKEVLGGVFNFISITNRSDEPSFRTRNEILGNAITEISRNIEDEKESEDIVRGTYTRPLSDSLSLELGIEGARNIIDVDSQVFFDGDNDGLVELFLFPTSHSRVKELRSEIFATVNWTISDALRMEGTLTAEYSKVSNNFDFIPSKDYLFPKPRIDLRYDISDSNQLGVKIERTVDQLNLNDFVPEFDFADNEVDAGNLGLSPETAWEVEIRWESRLPDDAGVIELRAFYNDIQDYLGKTIIGFDNNDPINGEPVSATGSWGKAEEYGAEIKTSLRLAWVGLPEVVIDSRFLYQNSEVIVPFSGEVLEFGKEWELDLGMRHDVTGWGMSYGITFEDSGPSAPTRDLNFSADLKSDPQVDVFVEKELFAGITARFEANGVLPTRQRRDRTRYRVANNAGVIERTVLRTEFYEETRDRRFVFSLRGTF